MTVEDLPTSDREEQLDVPKEAVSFYQSLEKVKNRHRRKGKRYPLALLFILLLGKMAGETKFEGIVDCLKEREFEIKKLLNWLKREKEDKSIIYGITSVPREIADAKQLLKLNREHWHIENILHYRRDVTFGEDASQIRANGVPEVFAALNGGLLALLDFFGVKNVAKYMRHCCAYPKDAVDILIRALWGENG